MPTPDAAFLLARLGAGDTIDAACAAAGLPRGAFDAWWRAECRRRVPPADGTATVAGPAGRVTVGRDALGVPHVEAGPDRDAFFGHGYAVAADRLFQLDWLRRRAAGRLAEVLGPAGVESDALFRTLNLTAVAGREWAALPADARSALVAFAAGVTALIDATRDAPPVEFDLLGCRPAPWSPLDSLLVLNEFRWYLTVRLPVICAPELARRALGDGPLYRAFLAAEADDESVVPPGSYPPGRAGVEPLPAGAGGDGPGSNNWALAASRTTTGRPLVASDPHIPFAAVSIWHEVVLRCDRFRAAGVALAGTPGLMIGRTDRVAWGVTNNICSLRDLYQERTSPDHPGCFEYAGTWEPARERVETIAVKGGDPVRLAVRSSRHGPVVDDLLPPAARGTGPVTLAWAGSGPPCGWQTSLVRGLYARTAEEFRATLEPWRVPTFNLVFADADGAVGHQATGRIPLRGRPERGYRRGWDPADAWEGFVPFAGLPRQADPPGGFVVTANNRPAPDDFPYPLSSTASSGHRARVIRGAIERAGRLSPVGCRQLQMDVLSGRAAVCLPHLLAHLAGDDDGRLRAAAELLRAWDGRCEADAAAPAVWNVFFAHWCRAVAAERFPAEQAEFAAGFAAGLACDLLAADPAGWFRHSDRGDIVRSAMRSALDELADRLGPSPADWSWGRLHTLVRRHVLSGRGELGRLLDAAAHPARGDGTTVHSTTPDAAHAAWLGAGYRMVADLSDPRGTLSAMEVSGSSGHPGSDHYDDRAAAWYAGRFHDLPLDGSAGLKAVRTLTPAPCGRASPRRGVTSRRTG